MQNEPAHTSNLEIWKAAWRFYIRNGADLLPVVPLIFIPIWTDCFHSVLIFRFLENGGKLEPGRAIGETLKIFPSFAFAKIKYFVTATLWAFIPVIGWYIDFRLRLAWAMASNIHVFERSPSKSVRQRGQDLVNLIISRKRTDALTIVPMLLASVFLILIAVLVTFTHMTLFFWIGAVVLAWMGLPGSAVVNTLVYLSITNNPGFQELTAK